MQSRRTPTHYQAHPAQSDGLEPEWEAWERERRNERIRKARDIAMAIGIILTVLAIVASFDGSL